MENKSYIDQLENMKSNKFSAEETTNLFWGILVNLLSDKELFKKNSEIDIFLQKTIKKQYKEYVFNGRPYLMSRVINDIKKENEYTGIIRISDSIIKYFEEHGYGKSDKKNNIRKTKGSSGLSRNVVEWFEQVNDKSIDDE